VFSTLTFPLLKLIVAKIFSYIVIRILLGERIFRQRIAGTDVIFFHLKAFSAFDGIAFPDRLYSFFWEKVINKSGNLTLRSMLSLVDLRFF
jgi:hypothetical protein